ncbi:hypothetical protein ACP70R_030170 [Stipagrostis hirtigluma subsp. patula]
MANAAVLLLLLAAVAAPLLGASGEETNIKVYWHDVVGGPNPTAVTVARAPVANRNFFGTVVVIDNALTEGPSLNSSRLVGRAQGTYIGAGKDVAAALMSMNFVFQAGEYNGSTVAIFGRNEVFSAVREMSIVGGTGVFRRARGYAELRTSALDLTTGDATVEYSLFIEH